MFPWEREIYVNLLIAYIKEEKEKENEREIIMAEEEKKSQLINLKSD